MAVIVDGVRAPAAAGEGGTRERRKSETHGDAQRAGVRLAAVGAEAEISTRWSVATKPCRFAARSTQSSSPHSCDLDDAVAALAEQMVVVRVAAQPVALLAAVV